MMTFLGATLLSRRACIFFSLLYCCDLSYHNSLSSSILFFSHFFHSCISSYLNTVLIPFFHSTLLSYLNIIYHHLTFSLFFSSIFSSRLFTSLVSPPPSSLLSSLLLFHPLRWLWHNCSQRCIGLSVPNFYKPLL